MSSVGISKRPLRARGRDKLHHLVANVAYPRLGYPVATSAVRRRRHLGTIKRSNIRDFDLGMPVPGRRLDLARFAPYFADYPRGVLHFARTDPERDEARPFFYMAQREFADAVASVAIERLDEFFDPDLPRKASPLLIFSIGRCGSTLLSELMLESGLRAYSEPDVFSQTGDLNGEVGRRLGHSEEKIRAWREKVLGVTLEALTRRAGGRRVCVKLRSGATTVFREIAETYPKADVVFLLRDPRTWARSWITAFDGDADVMQRTLLGCVRAIGAAREAGRSHRVVWYEDMTADPAAACAEIVGAPAADFGRVMAADSQQGTALSAAELGRRREGDADRIEGRVEQFLERWRAVQPVALLRAHDLGGLIA